MTDFEWSRLDDKCLGALVGGVIGDASGEPSEGKSPAEIEARCGGLDDFETGVEPVALGIADWHAELEPAGDTTVVFRESACADDVAKTNHTAILEQHGFGSVRSLWRGGSGAGNHEPV